MAAAPGPGPPEFAPAQIKVRQNYPPGNAENSENRVLQRDTTLSLIKGPLVNRHSGPFHGLWLCVFIKSVPTIPVQGSYAYGFSCVRCRTRPHQSLIGIKTPAKLLPSPLPSSRAQKTFGSRPRPFNGGFLRLQVNGYRLSSRQHASGSWPRRSRLKQGAKEAANRVEWLFQQRNELAPFARIPTQKRAPNQRASVLSAHGSRLGPTYAQPPWRL